MPDAAQPNDDAPDRSPPPESPPPKSAVREIVDPLIALTRAPRALWAVNIAYFLDGLIYFGMLSLLGKYFNVCVGLSDTWAAPMVGFLTWGVTFSMFLLGGYADRWSPRFSLVSSLTTMGLGRGVMVAAVLLFALPPAGLWSAVHWLSLLGLLLIVLGNGIFQPAAYAAVSRFTDEQTAPMGYAMLYAVMNLGGWLPSFISPPMRRTYGVSGVFWVYAWLSGAAAVITALLLTRRAVSRALAQLEGEPRAKRDADDGAGGSEATADDGDKDASDADKATDEAAAKGDAESVAAPTGALARAGAWLRAHPLADGRFAFFIFALIPVMTLFAHSWLTTPHYVERAFAGTWIGKNFEAATNLNPLLIFVLVPLTTAATQKIPVLRVVIVGTSIMALSPLLLVIGPYPVTLVGYLVVKSFGEALWQPRFLQYAAQIAPKGRTGAYMGVAQFPWFLTKMLTSLYAGAIVARYIPKGGPLASESMWALHTGIAVATPILLLLSRRWLGAREGIGLAER